MEARGAREPAVVRDLQEPAVWVLVEARDPAEPAEPAVAQVLREPEVLQEARDPAEPVEPAVAQVLREPEVLVEARDPAEPVELHPLWSQTTQRVSQLLRLRWLLDLPL